MIGRFVIFMRRMMRFGFIDVVVDHLDAFESESIPIQLRAYQ